LGLVLARQWGNIERNDSTVTARGLRFVVVALATAALLGLGFLGWSTESITLQGRWDLYTARCQGGLWQGEQCTGHLIRGEQYRFKVDKEAQAVAFDVIGAKTESGQLTECRVTDARNWACQTVAPDGAHCTVRQLSQGTPALPPDALGGTRPVSRWHWWLLPST
jgi:hypothetical protein